MPMMVSHLLRPWEALTTPMGHRHWSHRQLRQRTPLFLLAVKMFLDTTRRSMAATRRLAVVVHGSVYDASSWMDNHPCGIDSIMNRAGGVQDCSMDFEFHSNEARRLCT